MLHYHLAFIHLSPGLILLVLFGLATWSFGFDMASSISKEGTAHVPLRLLWDTDTGVQSCVIQTLAQYSSYSVPYFFSGSGLGLLMSLDSRRSHVWSGDVFLWGSCLIILLIFLHSLFLLFSAGFCFWLALIQFRISPSILIFIILMFRTTYII